MHSNETSWSIHIIKPLSRLDDIPESMAFFAKCCELNNYEDAISSDNFFEWKIAMDEEIKSIYINWRWLLMELPEDQETID